MSEPLVSVIIPTYNREKTVGHSVRSALDQTYRDLEVIVIDDGSTDGTADVLARFQSRIRVIRQSNAGPSAARNRGVLEARGEIIAFLDSDDTWFPGKISRQVALMRRAGPAVPCCLCNVLMPHLPYGKATSFALSDLNPELAEGVWSNPSEVLINRFVLFNQAVAVRKEALLQVGLFKEDMRLLEDYELALRLSTVGPWCFIKAPLVSYGVGQPNSLSQRCTRDGTIAPRLIAEILEEFSRNHRGDSLHGALRRQIRNSTFQWRAARCAGGPTRFHAGLGRGCEFVLRLREALIRRSPWLPRMRVSAVDELIAGETLSRAA